VNWTKTKLFRLTFAEWFTESKVWTQRIAQWGFRWPIRWVRIKNVTSRFGLSSVLVRSLFSAKD